MSSSNSSSSPFLDVLLDWFTNFRTNVSNSVSSLRLKDYIRLVWIIGAYLFLRPYLEKGFRKLFESGAAKAEEAEKERERAERENWGGSDAKAHLSGNVLRGVEGDEESDHEQQIGQKKTAPQWGKSARRRQRKFLEYVEEDEQRRKFEDEDRDIADLLED